MDETGMLWKRLPSTTYISKQQRQAREGWQISHGTLSFCALTLLGILKLSFLSFARQKGRVPSGTFAILVAAGEGMGDIKLGG